MCSASCTPRWRDEHTKLAGGLWIVTERALATEPGEPVDPAQAALWGLGRTIIAEQPVCAADWSITMDPMMQSASLASLLGTPGDEPELALRQGKFLVPRLLPWARSGQLAVPRTPTTSWRRPSVARSTTCGWPRWRWRRRPRATCRSGCKPPGVNFRDVLNALGLYPGDPGPVGGDLSGIVTAVGPDVNEFEVGQRVFGFVVGAFASRVNVPVQLLARGARGHQRGRGCDHTHSRIDRATRIRLGGAEARGSGAHPRRQRWRWPGGGPDGAAARRDGLRHRQHLQASDAARDGCGTRLRLAQHRFRGPDPRGHRRCRRRCGAQQSHQRGLRRGDRAGNRPERHGSSRSPSGTSGPGTDGGRPGPTSTTRSSRSTGSCNRIPSGSGACWLNVADGMASGEIAPLPFEIYPLAEAKTAFRRMQQARHIGKIVLQMPNPLQPRGDRSYLITGGLGALGLHTAAYLAQLGAGDIVLTRQAATRSGGATGHRPR